MEVKDVKEAIEFEKELRIIIGNEKSIGFTKYTEIDKNIDKVISLLQRLSDGQKLLEKEFQEREQELLPYIKMWNDLKELMKKEVVNKYRCSCCDSLTCNWRFPMKDLEKKYLKGGE